ncbi:MAG: hypothetical protein CUN55_01345 [Phototrophicales bacterium]|nr:MAG: hypothetical protein CUN55_01345 [Phototrophicales bacterium]
MHRLFRYNIWFRIWVLFFRPLVRTGIWLNNTTNGLLSRIGRAIDNFLKYGPHEASALSYYALFSLFPLLLLAIVILTLILDADAASNQIQDILNVLFPTEAAAILEDGVTSALEQRGSASLFAVIVLLWSSANLFGNLEKILNLVFNSPVGRKIYERRLVGILMILSFAVFLLASIITNLIFSFLGLIFLNKLNTWLSLASLLVPTAFNAAIFAVLYGFVPARRLRWDAILPASILGGLTFEFAKKAFVWYLSSLTNFSLVYGSVTTVVVFMLWMFVIFCIVLLYAEICAAIDDWLADNEAQHLQQRQPDLFLIPE